MTSNYEIEKMLSSRLTNDCKRVKTIKTALKKCAWYRNPFRYLKLKRDLNRAIKARRESAKKAREFDAFCAKNKLHTYR